MQKAPGSCAFAEWLGCRCGFGSCGSYDDDGASRSRCVSGVVGRHVFDGVRRGSGSVDDNVARERAVEEVFKAEVLIDVVGGGVVSGAVVEVSPESLGSLLPPAPVPTQNSESQEILEFLRHSAF